MQIYNWSNKILSKPKHTPLVITSLGQSTTLSKRGKQKLQQYKKNNDKRPQIFQAYVNFQIRHIGGLS